MIAIRLLPYDPFTSEPSEALAVWLAGDPALSGAQNPGIESGQRNHRRTIQEVAGPGYLHVSWIDRGNESSVMTFGTSRLFPTAFAARQWMNRWARQDESEWPHALSGRIIERFTLPDGTWSEEIFSGCMMQKPVIKFEGTTLLLTYSINFQHSAEGDSGYYAYLVAGGPDSPAVLTWEPVVESSDGDYCEITVINDGGGAEVYTYTVGGSYPPYGPDALALMVSEAGAYLNATLEVIGDALSITSDGTGEDSSVTLSLYLSGGSPIFTDSAEGGASDAWLTDADGKTLIAEVAGTPPD